MKRSANDIGSDYRPFKRYSFYLDLRSLPQLRVTLTNHIKTFGGRIEEFFNRNVKYVVTDKAKKDWPLKDAVHNYESNLNVNHNHNDDGAQSFANGTYDMCDQLSNQSSTSLSSHIAQCANNKLELISRGKLVLSKAGPPSSSNASSATCANDKKSIDILELSRLWGIKILPAIDMLMFCENHNHSKLRESQNEQRPAKVIKLKAPFIKVEDNRRKYRPVYKELNEWPDVNLETPDICPFIKKKINNEPIPFEGFAYPKLINKQLINEKKIVNRNNNAEKKSINKKKSIQFCEICQKEYDNLTKHLQSEDHVDYVNTPKNYKDVRSVISSLNNICSDTNVMNHLNDADLSDESDNEPFSPFTSTHVMPTKIQLRGLQHSSQQFLALHNLISPNFEQNNQKFSITTIVSPQENHTPLLNGKCNGYANHDDVSSSTDIVPPTDETDVIISESLIDSKRINDIIMQLSDNATESNDSVICENSTEF